MRRSLAVALVVTTAGAIGAAHAGALDPVPDAQASSNDATATLASVGTSGTSAAPVTVTPPSFETLERTCALLTSCPNLPLPPVLAGAAAHSVEACVGQMDNALARPDALTFSLTLRECALTATSCEGLRACALRGVHDDACAGRGKARAVGFCDEAGRAVTCLHGEVSGVRDCPRGNEECSASGGSATCTLGACPAVPLASAGASDGGASNLSTVAPYCSASGTHLLACDGSRLTSVDCAAFGLSCVAADASLGGVGCAPSRPVSAACATASSAAATASGSAASDDGGSDGPLRCEGAVAVGCLRGREARVDCGAAGMECNGAAGAAIGANVNATVSGARAGGAVVGFCRAPSLAPGSDEACRAGASHCDGNAVISCVAGKTRFLSCESIGLTRCVHDARGTRCR